MPNPASPRLRAMVDGKFFRLGSEKFFVKGVTYGPFPPHQPGEFFGDQARTAADFAQIRALGANLLRVYSAPPPWLLDLAAEEGLRVLVDVPWDKQACFLDHWRTREAACKAVRQVAMNCRGHPAVFGLSVVNEIPADVVRWSTPRAIEEFIDELVVEVKQIDPECPCTFGNYPPTEFLRPREPDFLCFNVYLHQRKALRNYLARLQMLAETKPLLLGEFGLDSQREGEALQAETLGWTITTAFRGGAAGTVVYSFSDEWFKDGRLVRDWRFGLTTVERSPKPAFHAVQRLYHADARVHPARQPLVSVVVACYNGARTLKVCLEALTRLSYPNYEIILVDDGSTDATPQIAAQFPQVLRLRQENQGLSSARNVGIGAAKGEIVAFTDADCRPDEDWLHYLVAELVEGTFAGVGGPNLLPPDDSWVAAAVLVSPGGPAHVMLTDHEAEHIPGCNMAFWKWALLEVGCFDPVFHRAGDDVDLCWRLQHRGYRLGFSPAGFVWHYRRPTGRDYLIQQGGYGEAEALLERKHPEYFNPLGGSIWRGRIYTPAQVGLITGRPMIYHGLFGTGLFQSLYTAPASLTLMLVTSLEYHVLVTLPLAVLAAMFRWLIPVALASFLLSVGMCVAAATQAELPRRKRRFWSRPLVALLFACQPIVRGWARYRGRLSWRQGSLRARENLDTLSRKYQEGVVRERHYWAGPSFRREDFLRRVLERLEKDGWNSRIDAGWSDFDVEVFGGPWCRLQLTTVAEFAPAGQQLLRCRLRTGWTLAGRTVFWCLLALDLLAIGLVGVGQIWMWLLLLNLPIFAWWLSREQHDLLRVLGFFFDTAAEGMGLSREPPEPKPAQNETEPVRDERAAVSG